jgi:TRAP-type uncharacterized transport system substrate-binding protein
MPANPLTTRSRVMLEMASEMVGGPDREFKQCKISFRSQAGRDWKCNFYGSSTYEMIDNVIKGEAMIAMMNPVGPLATAYRGKGRYTSPQPVRAIAVIPSEDQFVAAVRPETGIKTWEEFAAKKPPLKIGLRGQLDHGLTPMVIDLARAAGWEVDDLEKWGGKAVREGNIPFPDGPKFKELIDGKLDGVFDEASGSWANQAAEAGMTILPMAETTVKKLEEQGYRRAYMRKSVFPALKQDILTIDFSGWPIFVRADLDDEIVTQMCAGLDARKHNIPWEGEGPLPVERMAREAPDTPQDVPLHPAAERYWKSKGYL